MTAATLKNVSTVLSGVVHLFANTPGALASSGSPYTPASLGNDSSFRQCGSAYRTSSAFGIVGVTGRRACSQNACLKSEFE